MDPSTNIKTCVCCKKAQPASAFLTSRYYPDRLTPRCRSCVFGAAVRIRAERDQRAADQHPRSVTR